MGPQGTGPKTVHGGEQQWDAEVPHHAWENAFWRGKLMCGLRVRGFWRRYAACPAVLHNAFIILTPGTLQSPAPKLCSCRTPHTARLCPLPCLPCTHFPAHLFPRRPANEWPSHGHTQRTGRHAAHDAPVHPSHVQQPGHQHGAVTRPGHAWCWARHGVGVHLPIVLWLPDGLSCSP